MFTDVRSTVNVSRKVSIIGILMLGYKGIICQSTLFSRIVVFFRCHLILFKYIPREIRDYV